jgi:hypothetical protein
MVSHKAGLLGDCQISKVNFIALEIVLAATPLSAVRLNLGDKLPKN